MKTKKFVRNHPRNEKVFFHSPVRKENRERLFLQLQSLLLEQNRGMELEDRKHVVNLIMHKLQENNHDEKV